MDGGTGADGRACVPEGCGASCVLCRVLWSFACRCESDRLHSSPNLHNSQPRRIPERAEIRKASLQGSVRDEEGRAVPAVLLTIRSMSDGASYEARTDAEGIFRMRDIPLGVYELKAVRRWI